MADSYVTHTGDGTAGPFSFAALDYLSTDHLVVKVDGTTKTLTTHYTISGTDVTFTAGNFPASSAVIKIQRDTPRTKATRLVDFADGAVLTEADLDTAHLQNLYIAQESFENSAAALLYDDSLGAYTADSKEIRALADPSTDASAVNRKYVTDVASFGVPGIPQQFNTTITDGSTQFTLTGWQGVSQNMVVVTLDGVVQIPGTDFTVAASGDDTVLTLVGITPPDPTVLNVQNFGVAKSSTTLANDSVTTEKIVDSAVTNAKLAGSITSDKLADDAVTEAKIADDAVDLARLKDTGFTTAPGGGTDHALMIDRATGNLSGRDIVVADINDFNTVINAKPISTFTAATGNVNMGDGVTNYKISNTLDPTSDQDVATKAYVDSAPAVMGVSPQYTVTLTDQRIYAPAHASLDVVTIINETLPSSAQRPTALYYDWNITASSDSGSHWSSGEAMDVSLRLRWFNADGVTQVGNTVALYTVVSQNAGTTTQHPDKADCHGPIYIPATADILRMELRSINGTSGTEDYQYVQLSAVLTAQVTYTQR